MSYEEIENLLNLHGEIFILEEGFWVKFEAYRVPMTREIPHGIRYALTLHDADNRRVLGFDNAHKFKSTQRYGSKKESYDHMHKGVETFAYTFESPSKLLEDFWQSVECYLEERGCK